MAHENCEHEGGTHCIHTSERRSFGSCRLRWDWAYRDGYVPPVPPKPLEFGIAYHKAMEIFYDPDMWSGTTADQKLELAIQVFEGECDEQRSNYLASIGQRTLDPDERDEYQERIDLGTGMLEYYARVVHPHADNWFRPVYTEIPFAVPIQNPYDDQEQLHCDNSPKCGQVRPNPASVTYNGRVDMVVEDLRYGGYWLWDHKTAAQLIDQRDDFLYLDDQIASYVWALLYELRINIKGFVYAEMRKAFPKPPRELIKPKSGCKFSVDKRQITDYRTYVETVNREDQSAYLSGLYDEMLDFLKDESQATRFHQRFVIHKTRTELRNIKHNIAEETMDMLDKDLRVYPNVGRFTCQTCAYRGPCLSKFKGEDYMYTLNTLFEKVK